MEKEPIKSGRVKYIDIARGLAIFLVVWGHTLTSGMKRQVIYGFHMPLFFIISGALLKPKQFLSGKDYLQFIKKKFYAY